MELQGSIFPTECSKVAYIIYLLIGKACEWGTAVWDANFILEQFETFFS